MEIDFDAMVLVDVETGLADAREGTDRSGVLVVPDNVAQGRAGEDVEEALQERRTATDLGGSLVGWLWSGCSGSSIC